MRRLGAVLAFAIFAAVGVSGCGKRQVQVGTAPTTAESAIHFTNNLAQAVNVYVVQSGNETFVKQVGANTTEHLPVRGIAPGTQVRLKATTIDGKSTFTTQDPVSLTAMYTWKVP